MKSKLIYDSEKLRCKVSYNQEENCITLQLQYFCNWFTGWCSYRSGIDIEIDAFDKDISGLNPMILQYQISGQKELWATGTFDLNQRVRSLFKEYKEEVENIEKTKEKIKNLLV